ncbi:hypothetical protein ACWGI0_05115 [Streptomyces sp. NPDC054802]
MIDSNVGSPYRNPVADIGHANHCDIYQNGSHWIHCSHYKMPENQFYRYGQYPGRTYVLDLFSGNHPVAP